MKKFKAHILIVDDDDRIRELVKQYLNDNDYLATTAKNAEDAKEKTKISFPTHEGIISRSIVNSLIRKIC